MVADAGAKCLQEVAGTSVSQFLARCCVVVSLDTENRRIMSAFHLRPVDFGWCLTTCASIPPSVRLYSVESVMMLASAYCISICLRIRCDINRRRTLEDADRFHGHAAPVFVAPIYVLHSGGHHCCWWRWRRRRLHNKYPLTTSEWRLTLLRWVNTRLCIVRYSFEMGQPGEELIEWIVVLLSKIGINTNPLTAHDIRSGDNSCRCWIWRSPHKIK